MTSAAALEIGAQSIGDDGACVACGHPVSTHDTISLRYCAGTQLNALSRNCICPPAK